MPSSYTLDSISQKFLREQGEKGKKRKKGGKERGGEERKMRTEIRRDVVRLFDAEVANVICKRKGRTAIISLSP